MKRFIVITGRPGVGKTTLFQRLVERLESSGCRVVGFVCPEVRVGGRRVGFRIRSLDGSVEAWLAHTSMCSGARVGRYRVCEEAVRVVESIESKLDDADVVGIDEIGPMELRIGAVRGFIMRALGSGKPGVFVVHRRLRDPEIYPVLRRDGVWFWVSIENRDELPERVYREAATIIPCVKG